MDVLSNEMMGKIESTLQRILDSAHNSVAKRTIKPMNGRLTYACPYCGDSSKDDSKKRGNLFWDSLYHHCYNAGCEKHASFYDMLKDFGIGGDLSSDDRLSVIEYIKTNSHSVKDPGTMEFDLFRILYEKGIPKDEFIKLFKAFPIKHGSEGYLYLKERLLTHKIEHFLYNPYGKRLFVLNTDPSNERVLGYQIRRIGRSNAKYLTFNIQRMYEEINRELDVEEIEKLNDLSTIFGILSVDFSKQVTLFEGPIDSFFMRNSLGLSTVTRSTLKFDELPYIRYFFDSDTSGRKKLAYNLKQGNTVFLWKKFIKENELKEYYLRDELKDLNDIIKICYKHSLPAHQYINQYFSNKTLDAIYI